ncbi:MAG: hypothetical protein DWI00_02245 [Planctomycetota bacterium]|nr:MAG: hypothetical protein DWI00_02245 [Planctomycetota bacterium]
MNIAAKANRVCKWLWDIGLVRWLPWRQVAAIREVILGKEDLQRFAATPSGTSLHGVALQGRPGLYPPRSCILL